MNATFPLRYAAWLLLPLLWLAGGCGFVRNKLKAPASQLVLAPETVVIPFVWNGDTVNRTYYPEAVLLLPVTLPGCPKVFYMQLDFGVQTSRFYQQRLVFIDQRYHNIPLRPRPGAAPKMQLANYDFHVGPLPVHSLDIRLSAFGTDSIAWADPTARQTIGTLGSDFIDGRVAIIDYPRQRLILTSAVPDSLAARAGMRPFRYENRRVLLPVVVRGQATHVFFDTGSSTYDLLTNNGLRRRYARKKAPTSAYKVGSWGHQLKAIDVRSTDTLYVAGRGLPMQRISSVAGFQFSFLPKVLHVAGITGNRPFLGCQLILDTRRQQFGLLR